MAFKLSRAIAGDFNFVHETPNSQNLAKHKLVFCDLHERSKIKHHNVIELNSQNTIFQLKAEVINNLNGNPHDLECYIGIDPGNTTGVCIILNQVLIDSTVFYSKIKLISWIKKKIKELNNNLTIIRIGDGGGKNQKETIELLKKVLPTHVILQIVDEKNTSKKAINTLTSHEQAAIRIAKRKGYII